MWTKEAKEEMEVHTETAKTKVRKCSMQFRVVQTINRLKFSMTCRVAKFEGRLSLLIKS